MENHKLDSPHDPLLQNAAVSFLPQGDSFSLPSTIAIEVPFSHPRVVKWTLLPLSNFLSLAENYTYTLRKVADTENKYHA